MNKTIQLPPWIRRRVQPYSLNDMSKFVSDKKLNTVCNSALCPNRGECFKNKIATFMILGNNCTRNCRFCFVGKGKPEKLDKDEPKKVAEAISELGLKYAVITSVTRDDLPDGGAKHFADTIESIREVIPSIKIEVLIPDFAGKNASINKVVSAKPDVISHNLETVVRLYPSLRSSADYQLSLKLLKSIKKNSKIVTKSSLMLGLGETENEVYEVMDDLRAVDCDIITLGQYLSPSKKHSPVKQFINPEIFAKYESIAKDKGFFSVASGPFVRSSYQADKIINSMKTS